MYHDKNGHEIELFLFWLIQQICDSNYNDKCMQIKYLYITIFVCMCGKWLGETRTQCSVHVNHINSHHSNHFNVKYWSLIFGSLLRFTASMKIIDFLHVSWEQWVICYQQSKENIRKLYRENTTKFQRIRIGFASLTSSFFRIDFPKPFTYGWREWSLDSIHFSSSFRLDFVAVVICNIRYFLTNLICVLIANC